ncbi:hypothetical protein DXG03_008539 [Asterophora parasitica]|uniref:Uncharacterized protein n=1 Tax=Asterophora parasitica TaxID=117018 RepID=A0A9P7KCR4_9AGAR|nr:hypothetical protein DXG03_008539 [Asterophora parasitica]
MPSLLAPFTRHFIRSSASYTLILPFSHLGLLARAWGLACASITTWEFVNAIFDAVIFQPVNAGLQTPEPHVTLVSGATSTPSLDASPYPYAYLAYTELLAFSRATPESSPALVAHRSTLFNDQKYSTPSLWGTLVRSALVLLGEDYRLFLRRGAPTPALLASSAAASSNSTGTPGTPLRQSGSDLRPLMATPTPLIRTSIFQSQSSRNSASPGGGSVADVLGSDGPLARALDRGAEAVHIPELFRSVSAPAPATAAIRVGGTPTTDVGGASFKGNDAAAPKSTTAVEKLQALLQEKIHAVLPGRVSHAARELRRWWTRERIERVVGGALPRAEGVVVVVEGAQTVTLLHSFSFRRQQPRLLTLAYLPRSLPLNRISLSLISCILSKRSRADLLSLSTVLTHLVAASLTEDKYGVVQRDIPRILEALLSFLSAVEEYHSEIRASYVPPSPDATTPLSAEQVRELEERRVELERAGNVLVLVSDGLKAGVARIVRTFGDKLLAFKFPPRTAAKLQPFFDYC